MTFVCLFNTSYSQSKTQYEKKVDQIMIEMCNAIGVDNSLLQSAITLNDWDIVRTSQDFAFKCKMLDRNQMLVIFSATEQKLKDAEKLKNEEDFRKEKEKKEKERLLKEQQLEKELKMFSDLEIVKKEIQTEFKKWIKKDEFETLVEYNSKISNKVKKIDSIAYESVFKRINSLNCEYSKNRFFVELKNYDSERKIYQISLVHKVYYGGTFQNKIASIDDTLIIDIDLAKRIKENSIKGRLDWEGSNGYILEFCRDSRFFSNEINNWAISKSGFFYPITYNLLKEYTHTSKVFETPIIKMTINTNDLGLQEYFTQNHIISFETFIKRNIELKINSLISQAESLITENKFENALKLFREVYQFQQTEEVKNKILELEIKIIEKNQNELIKSAEQFERDGNMSNSIDKLQKAKELFLEANKLKFSDIIQSKILEIESNIIENKQNELFKSAEELERDGNISNSIDKLQKAKELLIEANKLKQTEIIQSKILEIENIIIEKKQIELLKLAEQFEKLGRISNTIEKLQEANILKIRADISSKIDELIKNRNLAITNHKIMDSLFIIAQSEQSHLFNDIISTSSLEEIKKGYGQKYLDCKTTIISKINSMWTTVSNVNTEINRNRNREVWNDKSQELMQKIIEFRNELIKNSNFEVIIQKALIEKDKKYLKIFKEEDVNIIIETILKIN